MMASSDSRSVIEKDTPAPMNPKAQAREEILIVSLWHYYGEIIVIFFRSYCHMTIIPAS
jgi:hypothetical protein